MTIKREVSELDKKNFILLRDNIINFMSESAARFDSEDKLLLDIAPQDHDGANPYFKKAKVETLDIDPTAGATYTADLCKTNTDIIPSEHFDIVVCTEVIEHTLNPFKSVAEISRVLKKGGVGLISVPFNFRIHGPLPDCWRISEHGLRALFNEESNFKILELTPLEDEDRFLMPIQYTLIVEKI